MNPIDSSSSEMAHLYYAEGVTSDSPGLFTDLKSDWYWSGTASEVYQNVWYVFYPPAGYQDANSDQSNNYAMAVFSGTLVTDAAPEPLLEGLAPEKPHSRYRHNGYEDNADAHLKRTIMGREVVVAVTDGKLDLRIVMSSKRARSLLAAHHRIPD